MPYSLILLQATVSRRRTPFRIGPSRADRFDDRHFLFSGLPPHAAPAEKSEGDGTPLQNGQTVLTSGGIVGTIVAVTDDTLILRIKPDNLKLQVSRSAVTSVLATDDAGKK